MLNRRKGSENGAGKLVRRERQKSGDWGRESQSPINVFVGGNDRGRIKHVLSANTSSFITLIRLYQIVCFVTLTLKQIMGDRRTGNFSSIFPRTATLSWLKMSKHIASVLLTVIKNTFRLRVFGNELYHAAVSETMFPNGK